MADWILELLMEDFMESFTIYPHTPRLKVLAEPLSYTNHVRKLSFNIFPYLLQDKSSKLPKKLKNLPKSLKNYCF